MASLAHRAGASLAVKALPAIYGAALVLLVVRAIPLSDFGRYGMAIAYLNILVGLNRGLWGFPLVIRAARGELGAMLAPAFWLSAITAGIGAVGAVVILTLLDAGFTLGWMVAVMLIILVPRDLSLLLLQAESRIWDAFIVEAGYFIGSLAGFILLAVTGNLRSAEAAMAVNIAAAILSTVVGLIYHPRVLRPGRSGDWRGALKLGRWIGLLAAGETYLQQGDTLLMGVFFEPVQIAAYVAARTLLRMYTLLSQAVNFLALPVASRLAASQDYEHLRRRLELALRSLLAALVPINVILWFACETIFPAVLGPKYVPAIPFFRVLILVTFFEPIYSVLANAVAGVGRPEAVVLPVLGALVFSFLTNFAMLPLAGMWASPVILVLTYVGLAAALIKVAQRTLTPQRA